MCLGVYWDVSGSSEGSSWLRYAPMCFILRFKIKGLPGTLFKAITEAPKNKQKDIRPLKGLGLELAQCHSCLYIIGQRKSHDQAQRQGKGKCTPSMEARRKCPVSKSQSIGHGHSTDKELEPVIPSGN